MWRAPPVSNSLPVAGRGPQIRLWRRSQGLVFMLFRGAVLVAQPHAAGV